MPITPEDLEPLVDSDEFKALSPQDRGTVLNGALREAHQYVTQNGGWTPERFKDFGTVAAGLRETALSKSVGEHVGGALSTVGNVIKDSVATMATAAAAQVMPEDMPFGMSTVGAALGTNMQKLGKSVQAVYSTGDDILGNELQALKHDIDSGQVPADGRGWSDWLDQRNDRMKQAQAKAYTSLEGDTPENRAFAESNSLLGNPRHGALLLDYLQTRDPAVWDELRKNVSMTPGRAKLEKQQDRIAKDTNLAKAMNAVFGEGAGNYIIEAGDPLEIAGNLLPMFKGAKVVKAIKGGSKLKAAGEAIVGAAGETASELGSQFMDDPNASWNQRLQVAKDAFIGALGLGGLGAGAQMVKDRFSPAAAVQDTAADPTKPPMRKPSDDLPPQRWTPRGQTMADMPEGAELTYDAQGQVTGWQMPALSALDDDLQRGVGALTPELQAKSRAILETHAPDTEAFLKTYFENHGKMIDADLMRDMLRSEEFDGADFTEATDPLVAALSREAARRAIDSVGKGGTVRFLAGGPASGKTMVREAMPDLAKGADATIDAPMATYKNAKALIDRVKQRGGNVVINYLHTPVEKAAGFMLDRLEKSGRETNGAKLADMHFRAQQTVLRLAAEHAKDPHVRINVYDNSGQQPRLATPAELAGMAYPSLDETHRRVHDQLRHEFTQRDTGFYTTERQAALLGGDRQTGRGTGDEGAASGVSDAIQAASGLGGETDGSVRPQPGQRPAGNPSQGSLERALDYLRRTDRGAVRGQREAAAGDGAGGASSAAAELAAAAGVPLMDESAVRGLKELKSGNEHDVFMLPADGGPRQVLKVTLPNLGLRHGPRILDMTAADYVERWQLSNAVFGTPAQLVGVMQTPQGVRLVMQQPFVQAANAQTPHPDRDSRELNRWLQAAGFEYQSGAWVRAEDGVVLNDEHEGNFIKTADGIRPIDVVISRLPDAKGAVISWEQTQQRLRAAGLETTPQSAASAAFNMDASGNGGPGASSLQEWGRTKFGTRLRADERLRAAWRAEMGSNAYRKETRQEWQQRANDFIARHGIEGAAAMVHDPDSGLSVSDRPFLGMQLLLSIDQAIREAERTGDAGRVSVLSDLMHDMAEAVDGMAHDAGLQLSTFSTWSMMSAEGVLRAFERKVHAARETHVSLNLGQDPAKIADEVSATATEERSDVAAEALGDTTADQLAELQRQVAELRQQLAQATQEASAAQQDLAQATTPADAAQAQKRAQGAEKRRQRAQRDLANAEARQQRKAAAAGKPRPPGQKKAKPLNPDELAARLIARLSRLPGQQTQRTKNQVHQLAEDYAAGRIDGPTLQSSLQALGVTPAQAATLQQLLDVKAAAKTTPETPGQKRQPSNLSRQAFDWIERLTFRHVFGGPPAPQTTSALSQLIRDYLKAPDAASLPDFNGQARALGLPPAEAVELQRLLDLERKAHAEIAHERAINRLISQLTPKLSTAKTRERMPRFLKKLLEAHELGTLDRPEFLKAYAEAFDLPVMDAATRQRIKALIDAQKAAPEGFLKQEATTKLMGELALFKGISALDVGMAFWYANLLSGLGTQAVNLWGNAWNLMLRVFTVGASHNPRETLHFLQGLFEGMKHGLPVAKAAIKEGTVPYRGDLSFTSGHVLELIHSDNPQTWQQRFTNGIALGRFVFRVLSAGDAIFYHTNREATAYLEAARYATTQQKLNGGAFSDYLAEQLGNGPERFRQAVEQAKVELSGTKHAGSFGHIDRRAWEIMEQQRPPELKQVSDRFGALGTFTQDPEGFFGQVAYLTKALVAAFTVQTRLGEFRPLQFVIPFVNIIANMTSRSLDLTPIGIIRGTIGHPIVMKKGIKGKERYDKYLPQEARDRFVAGILGTVLGGFVMGLGLMLRDRDDDEVPFMVYAMGPPDKNKRQQMPGGWKPYTLKVGDRYWSYSETPLAYLFAVIGSTLDYLRYDKNPDTTHAQEMLVYASRSIPEVTTKTGAFSGINELIKLMRGEVDARDAIARPVSGFVPAQGLLRDLSKLFGTPKLEATSIMGAVLKDVPVIGALTNRPALNIFGEPVPIGVTDRIPGLSRITAPQKQDPEILWLMRNKLWIPGMNNQVTVGTYLTEQLKARTTGAGWREDRIRTLGRGAADVLTPEERWKLVDLAGPGIRQAVKEMQAIKEQFPEATTEQLQERLSAKVVAQRRLAMRKVLGLDR